MNIFESSCNAISEVLNLNEDQKKIISAHFTFLSETIATHVKLQILKSSRLIEDEDTRIFLEKISNDIGKSISQTLIDNELIENLSALEHEQWMFWAKAVSSEVSEERRKRWESYFVPYSELDNNTKAQDRLWAQRVLMISSVKDFQLVEKIESKAIENLKSCLDNFDQGQFDPDLIDVYKNQVVHQFVDNMVEEKYD